MKVFFLKLVSLLSMSALLLVACGQPPVVFEDDPVPESDEVIVISPGGPSRGSRLKLREAPSPQAAGVYRMDSGFQPAHVRSAAGPDVLFDNQIASGYYMMAGKGQEWVEDAAVFPGASSLTAQLNGFEFSYCSEEKDAARNKGEITLRFYDETLPGRGPVAGEIKEYHLKGLPLGGPKGELRCWTIALDLTGGAECDLPSLGDEGILAGWSLEFHNAKTGPMIATGDPSADSKIVSHQGRTVNLRGDGSGISCKLYAASDGTQSYSASEPGSADFLRLQSSPVVAGGRSVWRIGNVRAGKNYSLFFSQAPLDDFHGEGSLLLETSQSLAFSPVEMIDGEVVMDLGPDFPGLVFVQALEHEGPLGDQYFTGFSNGLVHFSDSALLPTTGPSATGIGRGASDRTLPEFKTWLSWWTLNKEPFLRLRTRLRGGDGSPYTKTSASYLPDQTLVSQTVLPSLKGALTADISTELYRASLLALAKVGMERTSTTSFLLGALNAKNADVVESAVLGLGILSDPANIPALIALLADTKWGKELVDRKDVPLRTRVFAAYALGMIGFSSTKPQVVQEVTDALYGTFAMDESRNAELVHACILALGVLRPEDPRHLAANLTAVAVDVTETEELRAHALNASGRLLKNTPGTKADDLVEYCLALLDKKRAPKPMQRSAIQVLGLLASPSALHLEESIATLTYLTKKAKDNYQRSLALIALGRCGENTFAGSPERIGVEEHLVDRLRKSSSHLKGWAAMGLGVMASGLESSGESLTAESLETLHQVFKRTRGPSVKSACALALGLGKATQSVEDLRKSLKKVKDPAYRGVTAVALGLMDDRASVPLLLELLEGNLSKPELLRRTSLALALLQGQDAANLLLTMLTKGSGRKPTVATIEASSYALATLGNQKAVQPLVDILLDEDAQDSARVSAATSLGILVEHLPQPWNALYGQEMNYTISLSTLMNDDGTGLLNQE